MANQWFRFYAEFASDPKVQMMPENFQRRLMMLFCFRCNGHETLQDSEIVFQLRVTPQEWQETKAEFIARKFIDKDNKILNWDKRQFISDSSAARVSKHRENKKRLCNVTVTPPEQNTPEPEQNRKPPIPPVEAQAGVFKNGNGKGGFRIEHHIDDDTLMEARRVAQGWDIQNLMRVYDEGVTTRGIPKFPPQAFLAWLPLYTKGKHP